MHLGRVYVPCVYLHARWSYRWRFRPLLLCPLSVERYYLPLLVDATQTLQASFFFLLHLFNGLYFFDISEQRINNFDTNRVSPHDIVAKRVNKIRTVCLVS